MVRKATLSDVGQVFELINVFAKNGTMLPRSVAEIEGSLRNFFVFEEDGLIRGICALHICGPDLGELRSLAVRDEFTKRGVGRSLVEACLAEAKALRIKRVFALTYKTGFFTKLNFNVVDKITLPQKIWGDCIKCDRFPSCDETAVMIEVK